MSEVGQNTPQSPSLSQSKVGKVAERLRKVWLGGDYKDPQQRQIDKRESERLKKIEIEHQARKKAEEDRARFRQAFKQGLRLRPDEDRMRNVRKELNSIKK